MTFGELITLVRREIIVDDYADAYSDDNIRDALWRASYEIAAAFDFPRAVGTGVIAMAASSVPAPADCAMVHSLHINGDDARSVDLHYLQRMLPGDWNPVKYFNFDPRRQAAILIAPRSPGGTYTLEYTQRLTRPTPLDAAQPWNGVLPQFHPIIAYRAGVFLFQMDERENETQHWQAEYQVRASELASFLGRTDMSSLLVGPEMRDDRGATG
jgi:hypothetical protein